MASILEFRKSAFRFRPLNERSGAGVTADIVLFPGVRYERWGDEPSPDKSRSRRARQRDRLELDD
jgi:hypothetical protein